MNDLVFEEREAIYDINDDTASTLCNDRASTIYDDDDDDTSTLVDNSCIFAGGNNRSKKKDVGTMLPSLSVEATGCSTKMIEGKETIHCILTVHNTENKKQRRWKIEKSYTDLIKYDFNLDKARLPTKNLFSSNAPIKVDQRKIELDLYFRNVLLYLRLLKDGSVSPLISEFFNTNLVAAPSIPYALKSKKADNNKKEGYLTRKEGKLFGHQWKTHYCILINSTLSIYETKGGNRIESINLNNTMIGSQMHPMDTTEYRHALLIREIRSSKRHVFCAYSDKERNHWVNALSDGVLLADIKLNMECY